MTWLEAAILFLTSKVKDVLLKPKNKTPLDDHSFRQINLFSKAENHIYVLNLPDKNQQLLGNLEALPAPVKKELKAYFESPESDGQKRIRVIRSDFQRELTEYEKFFTSNVNPLNKILDCLRPDYESILRLAIFAKSHYDAGRKAEGDMVRQQVGYQYGRWGRKLCNLYLKGYVSQMMAHYVDEIIKKAKNRDEVCKLLNELIKNIIDFSEDINFVHGGTVVEVVAIQIVKAMKLKKPYIAIHSAGSRNKKIDQKIVDTVIEKIKPETMESLGYTLTQGMDKSASTLPSYDVFIVRKEEKKSEP